MNSRDTVLARIRNALDHTPPPPPGPTPIARDYLTTHADRTPDQSADLLAENLADYRANVHRTTATELPTTIARLLTQHGTRTLLTP
ncbi:lactate utilization protein C, partial [Streptomyces sp. NPDC049040]